MNCDKCNLSERLIICSKCNIKCCSKCINSVHESPEYADHESIYLCNECELSVSICFCIICDQYLCQKCDQKVHNKGARAKHERNNKCKFENKPQNDNLLSDLPLRQTMHKESVPFIPKASWKPFISTSTYHNPTLSGYAFQSQLADTSREDTNLYITPFQQFPIPKDKRVERIQQYLKLLTQKGEIIINKEKIISALGPLPEWKNENLEEIIKLGVNESVINCCEIKYSKDRIVQLISLKLRKISIECILWVIKSLELDEMTPTDRVIQSRIKESFTIKLQPPQWDNIMQIIKVCKTPCEFDFVSIQDPINGSLLPSIFPKGVFWEGNDLKLFSLDMNGQFQIFCNFLKEYFEEDKKINKTDYSNPLEAKAFPGGRYGCAHFVKLFGPAELQKYSIGAISQFVQKAINDNILQYHRTLLVWKPTAPQSKEDPMSLLVFCISRK